MCTASSPGRPHWFIVHCIYVDISYIFTAEAIKQDVYGINPLHFVYTRKVLKACHLHWRMNNSAEYVTISMAGSINFNDSEKIMRVPTCFFSFRSICIEHLFGREIQIKYSGAILCQVQQICWSHQKNLFIISVSHLQRLLTPSELWYLWLLISVYL